MSAKSLAIDVQDKSIWECTNRDGGKCRKIAEKVDIDWGRRIVRAVNSHEALLDFVKDIAKDECYRTPGEYPEMGEDGRAPCRSCQAREIINAIAQAEGKQ